MGDIEKTLDALIQDISSTGREVKTVSGEHFKYALKYLTEFRHLRREELSKRILIVISLCGVAAALWFKAEVVAAFLVEKSQALEGLRTPLIQNVISSSIIYRVFAVLGIPYIYVMTVGGKKKEEARQFEDKFELLGMVKQLNQFVVDEYGNKRRRTISPELIASFKKGSDLTIRLFKTNGFPLDAWEKKRAELEASFNEPIYQLKTSGTSLNVIQMVTVSESYKEKLEAKYKTELEYNSVFEKIGLVGKGTREINHFGTKSSIKNYPEYLDTEVQVINNKTVQILTFKSVGTELSNWLGAKFLMENVLNRLVVKIEQEKKNKQKYKVYTLDLADDLEESYAWKDELVDEEEGVIILGEGLIGQVKLDLNKLPHVLIGGVTNFGKSVLSNCITWQMIKKGALIIPIDFKGGIELDMFSAFHEVIFERERAIEILDKILKEYEARLKLIKSRKLKNISQFNKKYKDEELCRMIIVVDEIAEMLSGASSKAEANQIAVLDNQISTVARLARAVGIHLVLGTQRPDANVLQGQIKNNLPARICGRMIDKEPSLMILGTPDATRIPDIKGRFMFSLGADVEIFQAYYFKDSDIVPGNYLRGQCLVYEMPGSPVPSKNTQRKTTNKRVSVDDFEPLDPTEAAALDDDWIVSQIGSPDEDEEDEEDESEGEVYTVEFEEEEPADDELDDLRSDWDGDLGDDKSQSPDQKSRRVKII